MDFKKIEFDDIIRDDNLERIPEEGFDNLPFGSIRLNREGAIELYNSAEAELAHLNQEDVLGKDFFKDIAPCTDTDMFHGQLEELVATGKKSVRFNYKFLFPWGHRMVRIQFWVPDPDNQWIFVLPLEEDAKDD